MESEMTLPEAVQVWGSKTVLGLLDTSKASLQRLMKRDPTFPKPIRIGPPSSRSRLKWRAAELRAWIEGKAE